MHKAFDPKQNLISMKKKFVYNKTRPLEYEKMNLDDTYIPSSILPVNASYIHILCSYLWERAHFANI